MAISFLSAKNYDILETNWRFQKAEIDIIAIHEGELVIIEVKTRSTEYFGDPESFVTRKKQRLLIKAANAYIEEHDIDKETRFDVIAILVEGGKTSLKHIEGAFYPAIGF